MSLSPSDFDFIRTLVADRTAIMLEDGKEYLVESRLHTLLLKEGFGSLSDLASAVRSAPHGPLAAKVCDAMTTNETTFFRDLHPFNALRDHVLPDLIARRRTSRTLNIWFGASSSGQEPYSLAMLIREHFPELRNWTLNMVATDISHEMLERCREGRYSQLEVNRGLPVTLLAKYFTKDGSYWVLSEEVRSMITFSHMNLAGSWTSFPKLDLVMMRNVLIYFNMETKRDILGRVRRIMRPDGYLFLGTAETTINIDSDYIRCPLGQATTYRITPLDSASVSSAA